MVGKLTNIEFQTLDGGFSTFMVGKIYLHELCEGLFHLTCLFIEVLSRHGIRTTSLLLTYAWGHSLGYYSFGSSLASGCSCIEIPLESLVAWASD